MCHNYFVRPLYWCVALLSAGQTLAVYEGFLPQDVAVAAVGYAFPDPDGTPPVGVTRWNNPTNLYRSLTALTAVGRSATALAHLKERCVCLGLFAVVSAQAH